MQAGLLQFASGWCSKVYLQHLQLVQNAAVCLISRAQRHDHITPVLETLPWLLVRKRIVFKMVVWVWVR